jgi:hypothetical protein
VCRAGQKMETQRFLRRARRLPTIDFGMLSRRAAGENTAGVRYLHKSPQVIRSIGIPVSATALFESKTVNFTTFNSSPRIGGAPVSHSCLKVLEIRSRQDVRGN